jgi:hypothetical protein
VASSTPTPEDKTTLATAAPAEGEPKQEETKAAPFEVEKLTFPEGFEKDEKLLGQFGEIAKSANVSHEAAQQFLDLHASALKAASEASRQSVVQTIESWENEIKADKDIGGDKLRGVQASIAKVIDDPRFTVPGLREALDVTGAGSHPAVFRWLAKLAAALTEGGAVSGSPPAQQTQRSAAQVLFPNQPSSEAR